MVVVVVAVVVVVDGGGGGGGASLPLSPCLTALCPGEDGMCGPGARYSVF